MRGEEGRCAPADGRSPTLPAREPTRSSTLRAPRSPRPSCAIGTKVRAITSTGAPDAVKAAHASVKRLTDLLKSQFVTTLNLSVPQEGAADND